MRKVDPFKDVVARLQENCAAREQIASAAFSMLEERLGNLSNMLVIGLGDRARAVRWMCMCHRNLGGRNAYQAIADGEEDQLWEVVQGLCGMQEY